MQSLRASLPLLLLVCTVLLALAITAGVWVGSVGLSPGTVWTVIWQHLTDIIDNCGPNGTDASS